MKKIKIYYKIVLTHITTHEKWVEIKELQNLTSAYQYAKYLEGKLGYEKWVTTKIELLYE